MIEYEVTCESELVGVSGALGLLVLRSLRMAATVGSMTTRVGESTVSGSDGRWWLENCSESCDLECVCIGENGDVDLNDDGSGLRSGGSREEVDGEKGRFVGGGAAAAVTDEVDDGIADERRRCFGSERPKFAFGSPPLGPGPSTADLASVALGTLPLSSVSLKSSTNSQSAVVGLLVSSITTRLLVRFARSPSGGTVNTCVRVGTKTLVKTRLWIGAEVSDSRRSSSPPLVTSLSRRAMLLSMTSLTECRSWCDPQLSDLGRLVVSDSVEELLALERSRCRSSIFFLWSSRS